MVKYKIKKRKKDEDFQLADLIDFSNTKTRCYICRQVKWCQEINVVYTESYNKKILYLCESCSNNYYNEQPEISDAKYDTLEDELRAKIL